MNLKLLLLLLCCGLLLCRCSFTSNMHAASNIERTQDPRYQYIHDYYSRVRQVQMLNRKREVKAYNTISYVLEGDESSNQEKNFKRIKLKNKSARMLYADVLSEVTVYEMNPIDPVDTIDNVNVKKIRIPPGESLSILLWLRQPYTLTYSFTGDDEKNLRHDFIPESSRTRFIISESRIKGSTVRTKQ